MKRKLEEPSLSLNMYEIHYLNLNFNTLRYSGKIFFCRLKKNKNPTGDIFMGPGKKWNEKVKKLISGKKYVFQTIQSNLIFPF